MSPRAERVALFLFILLICLVFTGCATYEPHSRYSKLKDPVMSSAIEGCRAQAIYHEKAPDQCLNQIAIDLMKKYSDIYDAGFKAGKAGGRCEQIVSR